MSEELIFGREKEIRALMGIIDEVLEGISRVVFVVGEAGIGKTSLVRYVGKYATHHGFLYVEGKAEGNESEPYRPFKEIFRKFGVIEDKKDYSGMESVIVGEPSSSLPLGVVGIAARDEQSFYAQRHSMWWNTTKWLKDFSLNTPLFIFIDDLQYADAATVQLIYFLKNNLGRVPVLLIAAYREEEMNENAYLKEIVMRMRREGGYVEINLKPLDDVATENILKQMLKKNEIPYDFVRTIIEITKGNPILIKSIVEEMISSGNLDPERGIYPKNVDEVKVPNLVESLVNKKLKSLDDKSIWILSIGSVIGYEVPYALLEGVSQMDELALLEHIEKIISAGLWIEDSSGEKFLFSEKILREVIYSGIKEDMKRSLHIIIGNKILEMYADNIEPYFFRAAYHYEMGGDNLKAVEFYLKAGEYAERIYAVEDALEIYRKALELSADREQKVNIFKKLGNSSQILGKYSDAEKYYREALKLVEDESKKMEFYAKIAEIYNILGEYDTAIQIAEKSITSGEIISREACLVMDTLGTAYLRKGDYQRAREFYIKELKIAEKLNDKEKLAQAYHAIGSVSIFLGKYRESIEYFIKAMQIREDMKDYIHLSSTYNNLGVVYQEIGEIMKALYYFEKSLHIVEKIGDKYRMQATLDNIASIYLTMGELDKALEYSERSLKLSIETGNKNGIGLSYNNLGNIYLLKGKFDDALLCFKNNLQIQEETGNKYGIVLALTNIGEVYISKGDYETAREYYNKAIKICEEIGDKFLMVYILKGFAEIELENENIKKARKYIEDAINLAREIESLSVEGICYLTLGKILRKEGEMKEALKNFEKCIDILEEMKDFVDLPEAYYEYAKTLILNGNKERGRNVLEKAMKMVERMGLNSMKNKIEELSKNINEKS